MNYNTQHKFYCGVDLHARSMFVHIVDHKGKTVFVEDPDTNRRWLRADCSTALTEAASPATPRRSRLRSGTQRREGAHAFSPEPPAASGDGRLGGKSMWKTKAATSVPRGRCAQRRPNQRFWRFRSTGLDVWRFIDGVFISIPCYTPSRSADPLPVRSADGVTS